VTVGRLDSSGAVRPGSEERVAVDVLAVGWGFTPQLELPLALGCVTRTDIDGSLVVVVDDEQRTSVDGVYVAGDTILCDEVWEAIERHEPRVKIVNAGGARFLEGDPIVMTAADVAQLDGTVVVVHLEAINHCHEPRSAYTGAIVPSDGEVLDL
jgi:pyruvate/2-oxoglutarate dehydrogenase complex dihydrolipoamide dehydrogenase (E3) component